MKDEKDIIIENEMHHEVSPAVIKRLPRYFRYLREIIRMGKTRVSSAELSKMMNVTASQIRQDLNCFGVGCGFRAAVIGAGNLGTALVKSPMFEKRGVDVVAMFDVAPSLIGKKVANAKIYSADELEARLEEFAVDIVILTLDKEYTLETAQRLAKTNISGIWNLTGIDLDLSEHGIAVENVHIGDSLMTLCYEIALNDKK